MFRTNFYNKNKTNKTKKPIKDDRANWEYSHYQRLKIVVGEEQKIKLDMAPTNCFDPKNVHDYITPKMSNDEIIYQKFKSGIKLSKKDNMILANIIKKKQEIVTKDIESIEKFGFNAQVVTKQGKTRLLLKSLVEQISKENTKLICNIYLRLKENTFELTDDIKLEFDRTLVRMNEIVRSEDLIQLQFEVLYSQMPPLNFKEFEKFDPWQVDVINNIDKKISTIVSAPTSAGKTVLSGYATTKGKTLFVVPTDALAWQMSAYIGKILGTDVPIITSNYQTIPKRDLLIELLNGAQAIVGTADSIVDYLPLLDIKFDWIIFDEIHMIGKQEGSSMEILIKLYDNVPFLALSATIGNIDELKEWFQKLNPEREIETIVCDKRFFNLQRFYYNPELNETQMIHPLALVNSSNFEDRTILKKNLQPTPPDTWALYTILKSVYGDLGMLNHTTYFDPDERIQLAKANNYFNDLIMFMIDNYNYEKIEDIISKFKNIEINDKPVDLVDLALLLKKQKKAPAIIFQKNTLACLRMVRQFAKSLEQKENIKFPKLRSDRIKEIKKIKKIEQTKEKSDKELKKIDNGDSSKKELKVMMDEKYVDPMEDINVIGLQEPTSDFNLNPDQYFSEGIVEEWIYKLKKYFPSTGTEYHFLIKLLWRGVGVYTNGLPEPYLRLVQNLASNKKLAIVFSDSQLVFGVSMPFRTVVIYKDLYIDEKLDSMLYHQMAGRAGRRGLDKEGNIIFANLKWKEIEDLSICPIPNITGISTVNYCVPHANKLSELGDKKNILKWDKIFRNALNKDSDEDNIEMLEGLYSNYSNGWNFAISNDINHLHMMWMLRNSEDAIIVSFILSYIKKGFEAMDPNVENNQVLLAHFISHFIHIKTTKIVANRLPKCPILEQPSFMKIYDYLEELQLDIPENIDNLVWISIKNNSMVVLECEKDMDILRQRIFNFGEKLKAIQHMCFHSKMTNLSKLLGKLLTRIWWIYHLSSPLMKPFVEFDNITSI